MKNKEIIKFTTSNKNVRAVEIYSDDGEFEKAEVQCRTDDGGWGAVERMKSDDLDQDELIRRFFEVSDAIDKGLGIDILDEQ